MSSGEECVGGTSAGDVRMREEECRVQLEKKVLEEEVLVGPYGGKTRLLKLINGGSFGQIFLGEYMSSGKKVAVKIEHPNQMEQLLYEGLVYRKLQGGPGIPSMFWYGMHGSLFNVMVMELLGPSLQDLLMENECKFSLKTVLLLADQMLDTVQFLHERNFVHRDLSPNNFVMGLGDGDRHRLHLVDYGLAKETRSALAFRTGKRGMTFKLARPMVGTARFCSIFCQRGEEEARRDDMASLCYLLVYLLRGVLPWQGVQADSHATKLDKIYELKITTSPANLCAGLPEEFTTYATFVQGMAQYDLPDYDAIRRLFCELAKREGIEYNFLYDWSIPMSGGGCEGSGCQEEERNGDGNMEQPPGQDDGRYLRCPRTVSTCSSSPSDTTASH